MTKNKHPPKKFHRAKNFSHNQSKVIQKAILDTLKYRQIFNYPMTYHQLWMYLIVSPTLSSNPPINPDSFNKELDSLVTQKRIVHQNNLYSLKKIDCGQIDKRKTHSANLLTKASLITGYLKHISWVELVAVTGSVAAFNADDKADIDILMITKPNRLFLSRLFLVLTLKLLGVYWNAKKPAGTVCPNIIMTSDNLNWNENDRNLYIANEISLLYSLYYKNDCYFDFQEQNSWINDYLPNFQNFSKQDQSNNPKATNLQKSRPTHNLADLSEVVAKKIQLFYMGKKLTTEIITNNFIHFNTHDSAPSILQNFQTS